MGWTDAPRAPLSNGPILSEIGRVEDSLGGTLASTFHAGGARGAAVYYERTDIWIKGREG